MRAASRWALSPEEQQQYIDALKAELAAFRAKLGITQSELAYLVGVSRQTYSAVESGKRPMSWSIFLSLLVFFDYNLPTHQMLRSCGVFPEELVERFNDGKTAFTDNAFYMDSQTAQESMRMLQALDAQGVQSLKTTLLVEYARCTGATNRMMKMLEP